MKSIKGNKKVYQQWRNLITLYPDKVDVRWLDPFVSPVKSSVMEDNRLTTPIIAGGFYRFCEDMFDRIFTLPRSLPNSELILCLDLSSKPDKILEVNNIRWQGTIRHKKDLEVLQKTKFTRATMMLCELPIRTLTPKYSKDRHGEGPDLLSGIFSRSGPIIRKGREPSDPFNPMLDDWHFLTSMRIGPKKILNSAQMKAEAAARGLRLLDSTIVRGGLLGWSGDRILTTAKTKYGDKVRKIKGKIKYDKVGPSKVYKEKWFSEYCALRPNEEVSYILSRTSLEGLLVRYLREAGLTQGTDYYLDSVRCLSHSSIKFVAELPESEIILQEWVNWGDKKGDDPLTPHEGGSPNLYKINESMQKTCNKKTFSEDLESYGDYRVVRIIKLTDKDPIWKTK